MYFLIHVCIILLFQDPLFGVISRKQEILKSRTVVLAATKKTPTIKNVQKNNLNLQSIVKNQEEYVLVPKKLIGSKLARYFSGTSASVVSMSCCPQIQVHRRCLRDLFHAHEHKCSDQCPGCYKKVDRHVFAQSRPSYVLAHHRKKLCDFCYGSLKK